MQSKYNIDTHSSEGWLSAPDRGIEIIYKRKYNRDIPVGQLYYEYVDKVRVPVMAELWYKKSAWEVYTTVRKETVNVRGWDEEQIDELFSSVLGSGGIIPLIRIKKN